MTDDWFNYSDPYSPTTADYWLDHHPRTYEQWKRQQAVRNIPLIGQLYGSYLVGKAQAEFVEQQMQASGIEWSDYKNPYHSSLLNSNSGAGYGFYGAFGSTVSSNIKRLYR